METTKALPKNLIPSIIERAASLTNIQIEDSYINDQNIQFYFKNKERAAEFEDTFGQNIFKSIKKILKENDLNVNEYTKNLTLSTLNQGTIISIGW